MQVIVNGRDISKYINESSYKADIDKQYEEWLDGNYVRHRIYTRDRIKASFTVALFGLDGMTTSVFMNIWNGAVTNNVAMVTLYVPSLASNQTINAYYTMETNSHRKLSNGTYLDLIDITLEER